MKNHGSDQTEWAGRLPARTVSSAEGQVHRASPALAGRTGRTNCEDSQSGIATISEPVHSILKWEDRNQQMVYDLASKRFSLRFNCKRHQIRPVIAFFVSSCMI
jgi:hypothetical protein